jgi:hypothetical protein
MQGEDNSMKYEVRATFNNAEDARAFKELARGLADELEFRTIDRIVTPSPPLETRLGRKIFSKFEKGRSYTLTDVASWCEEFGYAGTSGSGLLHRMVTCGNVVRVREGVYELPREQ